MRVAVIASARFPLADPCAGGLESDVVRASVVSYGVEVGRMVSDHIGIHEAATSLEGAA